MTRRKEPAMFSQSYPSLEAFYAADRRRRRSRERDFGLLWRDNGHAWVQETGEVTGSPGSLFWLLDRADGGTLPQAA